MMVEKFFGLSVGSLQDLVNRYGCVIKRQDLVEVVTVEWLEKEFCKKEYCTLKGLHPCEEIGCWQQIMMKAVRLRVVEKEE